MLFSHQVEMASGLPGARRAHYGSSFAAASLHSAIPLYRTVKRSVSFSETHIRPICGCCSGMKWLMMQNISRE